MKNVELYPFQRTGVRFLRDQNGTALLADEVGLGKTVQALYYSWRYLPKDPPGPIVVVVPAHLKTVWAREAKKHLNLHAQVLHHERVPDEWMPPTDPNSTLIVNYDILTPSNWKPRTAPPESSWVARLAALRPRLLIGDEGQVLSNSTSARTRAFRWLARRTPRCLILSGTPLPNKPENLWSILNILRPKEFDSRFEFLQTHTHATRRPWGWEFKGAKDLDVLHDRLSRTCMIRRRKVDVLKDLPQITYSVVPLECDLRDYRKAEKDVIAWIKAQDAGAAERASRAVELARMNTLMQLAAASKIDVVVKWVRGFLEESDGKLLLGVIHYKTSDALMKALGAEAVLIDGRLTDAAKTAGFDRFNRDKNCRLCVANIQAAGTGWSCTSASDVAFVELPWRPSDVTQFCGRIHGVERGVPGAGAQVNFLVAPATIEEDLCAAIQRKARCSSLAIDGAPNATDLDLGAAVRAAIKARGF